MTNPTNDPAPLLALPTEHELMHRAIDELDRAGFAAGGGETLRAEQHRCNAELWLKLADRARADAPHPKRKKRLPT